MDDRSRPRWRTAPIVTHRSQPTSRNGNRSAYYDGSSSEDMTSYAIEELTRVIRQLVKDEDPVVSVLPGGGWLVAMDVHGAAEAERVVEPVIGWLVRRSGDVQALRSESDNGWAITVGENEVVFHPDSRCEPGRAEHLPAWRFGEDLAS